jgi:D-beta-D-heptose 7-phosphate kinase/D-beta-D-heptose 1-phosphate adenosyltransferase
MKGKKILVVGDVMVDEFLYGRVERISPEAPVPVLEFSSHVFIPGGAANAANNIKSLGGEPLLLGCVGEDATAQNLKKALEDRGIEFHLLADAGRPTILKTRVVAHNQQVVRIDREKREPLPLELEERLIEELESLLGKVEGILVSDYQKGTVTVRLMRRCIEKGKEMGLPVVVDSKAFDGGFLEGATIFTPNRGEAERLVGYFLDGMEKVTKAGREILHRLHLEALLITLAEEGMFLFEEGKETHIPAATAEVHDVTGAGDTVAAALSLALSAEKDFLIASQIANLAAGVVVRKIGTATATPSEVEALWEEMRKS